MPWFSTPPTAAAVNNFLPHGYCLLWSKGLLLLHLFSDTIIAVSFYSIPVALLYFARRRQDLPYKGIFVLFGLFIAACGMTHAFGVWTLWHPDYWADGLTKAATAVLALFATALIWPLIPHALAIPTRSQLETANRLFAEELKGRFVAEQELRESRERLRFILDSAHIGVWELDSKNQAVYRSPLHDQLFGYDPPRPEWRYEDFLGHVLEEDKAQVDDAFRMAAANALTLHLECRIRRVDGAMRWLRISGEHHLIGHDHVFGLTGMVEDITERKLYEQALSESEARFRLMADSAPVLIWISGTDKLCTWFNKPWLDFTGHSLEQELGNGWAEGVHPDDFQSCLDIYSSSFDQRQPFTMEYRLKRHDGEYRWLSDTGIPRFDENGLFEGYIGSCIDITARKLYEARLELSARVFTHAREAIAITDAGGCVIEVNETFTRVTGYSNEEVVGQVLRLLRSEQHSPKFYADLWHDISTKGHWYGEIWDQRRNGDLFAAMLTISPVLDPRRNIQNYVALFTDVTQLKEYQRQLEHTAHYDVLTRLPNRALLNDRLGHALVQTQRRGSSLAVVYLDLDGFKAINDQYGHDVGDELLVGVSQRMKAVLREGDTLARVGGDEFVAILGDLQGLEDCQPILVRLLRAAAEPLKVGSRILQISVSIGVTFYPKDNANAGQLLRHADQAMYRAKQAGRNRYQVYDVAQETIVSTRHRKLERIRTALRAGEFTLYYQPKVNLRTRRLLGAEALIRWLHPEHGLLLPGEFLPIIENDDLSIELDEWVMDVALAQMADWQVSGLDVPVSLNIGARHLQRGSISSRLRELLNKHPTVRPESLELEILESSAIEDIDQVSRIMRTCRGLGVRFALDDFGTGYCSLTYLKHLPADVLKIDQSFVRDMLDDPEDLTIIKGVVGLAEAFHREVIAEGVESLEHGNRLLELGCEMAQGHGIARPMPAKELSGWISSWECA